MSAKIDAKGAIGRRDLTEYLAENLGARAEPAVLLRNVETHESQLGHALANAVSEPAVVIVLLAIDGVGGPGPEGIDDHALRFLFLRRQPGKWEDHFLAQLTQKDALRERRILVRVRQVRLTFVGRVSFGRGGLGRGHA